MYASYWDQALASNPPQLGINAASAAKSLGVGIEIDYENNSYRNLTGVQRFINAYRSLEPYARLAPILPPASPLTWAPGTATSFRSRRQRPASG